MWSHFAIDERAGFCSHLWHLAPARYLGSADKQQECVACLCHANVLAQNIFTSPQLSPQLVLGRALRRAWMYHLAPRAWSLTQRAKGWSLYLDRGTNRSRGATRLQPAVDLTVRAAVHSLSWTQSGLDGQKPRITRMQRGRVRCTTDIHVRRDAFLNRCVAQRQSLPHSPRTERVRRAKLLDETPTDMDVRRTGAHASVSPRACPAATHVCDTWLAVTSCTLAPLAISACQCCQAHPARSASATHCRWHVVGTWKPPQRRLGAGIGVTVAGHCGTTVVCGETTYLCVSPLAWRRVGVATSLRERGF